MSPSRALTPDRRQRLLQAAVREFAHAGYRAASLNRIIRTCRLSKSSFYYYVDSKDALFDMVVDELGRALLTALDPPRPEELAGPDFWARLHRLAARLGALAREDQRFLDFGRLFALGDGPTDPDRPLQRCRTAINDWLDQVLLVGRTSGMVRDDLPSSLQRDLTLAVVWAMDAWTVQRVHTAEVVDPDTLAAAEVDAVRRLLAPA